MVTPDDTVEAFIAVGSNLEPMRHIPAAMELLGRQVRITGTSTFYRTPPLGGADQPWFCNGVWRVETALPARELKFELLRPIEARLGRCRVADRYAPRTIDLDVVLYGDCVIRQDDLRIPAPDVRRVFVAWPLLELAPGAVLPDSGEAVSSLVCPAERATLQPAWELTDLLREILRR